MVLDGVKNVSFPLYVIVPGAFFQFVDRDRSSLMYCRRDSRQVVLIAMPRETAMILSSTPHKHSGVISKGWCSGLDINGCFFARGK